jgi:hypothetical protein
VKMFDQQVSSSFLTSAARTSANAVSSNCSCLWAYDGPVLTGLQTFLHCWWLPTFQPVQNVHVECIRCQTTIINRILDSTICF